jgi:hypothetical protein
LHAAFLSRVPACPLAPRAGPRLCACLPQCLRVLSLRVPGPGHGCARACSGTRTFMYLPFRRGNVSQRGCTRARPGLCALRLVRVESRSRISSRRRLATVSPTVTGLPAGRESRLCALVRIESLRAGHTASWAVAVHMLPGRVHAPGYGHSLPGRNGPRAGRSGQRAEQAVARLDLLCNEFTRGSRAFHLS